VSSRSSLIGRQFIDHENQPTLQLGEASNKTLINVSKDKTVIIQGAFAWWQNEYELHETIVDGHNVGDFGGLSLEVEDLRRVLSQAHDIDVDDREELISAFENAIKWLEERSPLGERVVIYSWGD
jgi:hypothetical protein